MDNDYIEGIFVEECNNRFLCVVESLGHLKTLHGCNSAKLRQWDETFGIEVSAVVKWYCEQPNMS